ncbi:MAG: hypothetical protein EOO37_02700 [Cytophagaceae bacterium]|nr:MAG: hypothetical protein EOO37_02700 [Cytophagaceae bacterium]
MPNFTFSFASGVAAVALLLAAPAAHAQSTGFMTADSRNSSSAVASISPASASRSESPAEATRNLSAPADEAATANYYNDSHKDLKQALAWMQDTNALHPEYWSVYAEARIRLQLKDYAGAQATAAEAKKLALAASNSDYARRSDELLTQAKTHSK